MKVKKEVDPKWVEAIVGETSHELADKCPDRLVVFPSSPCTNIGCEYAIKQPCYKNCTFVAAEAGEHTLEAIGEMMGITREGVRVIEKRAMKKLRAALDEQKKPDNEHIPSLLQPRLAPRKSRDTALRSVTEPKDPGNFLPAFDGGKLGKCLG